MKYLSKIVGVFAILFVSSQSSALDSFDKALYIAKAQRTGERAMFGLNASFRDAGQCVGSKKPACELFLSSVDYEILNRITAELLSKEFTSEDIDNLYLYFTRGPGEKEMQNVIIQVMGILYPDEVSGEHQLLTQEEISYRSKFNATDTGVKYGEFSKVASQRFQAAINPYLSNLAKEVGLIN